MTKAKQTPKTRRKMKVIGHEEYINSRTGEIETMEVIRVEERDANFHKIWIAELMRSLDLISNQKTKIAYHLLECTDRENRIIKSYNELAKECDVSYQTVAVTMKALLDAKFLVRQRNGVYIINPDVVFKGGFKDRMNVLYKFYNTSKASDEPSKASEANEPSKASDEPSKASDEPSKASDEPSKASVKYIIGC